jgi:hypothetical protein
MLKEHVVRLCQFPLAPQLLQLGLVLCGGLVMRLLQGKHFTLVLAIRGIQPPPGRLCLARLGQEPGFLALEVAVQTGFLLL